MNENDNEERKKKKINEVKRSFINSVEIAIHFFHMTLLSLFSHSYKSKSILSSRNWIIPRRESDEHFFETGSNVLLNLNVCVQLNSYQKSENETG